MVKPEIIYSLTYCTSTCDLGLDLEQDGHKSPVCYLSPKTPLRTIHRIFCDVSCCTVMVTQNIGFLIIERILKKIESECVTKWYEFVILEKYSRPSLVTFILFVGT